MRQEMIFVSLFTLYGIAFLVAAASGFIAGFRWRLTREDDGSILTAGISLLLIMALFAGAMITAGRLTTSTSTNAGGVFLLVLLLPALLTLIPAWTCARIGSWFAHAVYPENNKHLPSFLKGRGNDAGNNKNPTEEETTSAS